MNSGESEENTPNESSLRIQSAMVLFALEEALGAFVVQAAPEPDSLPDTVRTGIEKQRNGGESFASVTQIVQETYIKEVIDLADGISKDRSENQALKRLRLLVESLEAFEIRNAVCHPNRVFPECYWHRMAALATDPCIQQLRLRKVEDAFRCASEGRLSPPPEGWLNQHAWNVPNNLPTSFDHQITGLIARQSEAKDLLKRLQNLRNSLIAIVGPGGTGKTALCLQVLKDCVHEPATLEWADQVVFVTAKTERLTATGVEAIIDPLTSLESVKTALAVELMSVELGELDGTELFAQAMDELGERRLLLCIDNLETLLRDHPQEVEDFIQALPREWRVIVTSRVTVNGANVLALGPIKKSGAMKLTREYAALRGAARLEEEQVKRLVGICDSNPLAIRLVIDSYLAGSELATALQKTRDQITDFSYTSLVEHLPSDSAKVLECLFGASAALSRGEIGNLLGLTPDEVAEAVNSLLKTSLVTRRPEATTERYELSSSVRELLLRVPRDSKVRDYVHKKLREQQLVLAEFQRRSTTDTFDESFVPEATSDHVRALVAQFRRCAVGRSTRVEQVNALAEVRSAIAFDVNQAVLHRTEALLLQRLNDKYGAIDAFLRATNCESGDPCSRLHLAELLRDEQRLEEAIEQTTPLVDEGYLSNSEISQRNRTRLLRAHWVSVLWMEQYSKVLDATQEWNSEGDLRPAYVALRVSALSRCLSLPSLTNVENTARVIELVECLSQGFRIDGYLHDVVHEAFKACQRVQRQHRRNYLEDSAALGVAEFLDRHLVAMCGTSTDYAIGDKVVKDLVLAFQAVGTKASNPLSSARWSEVVDDGQIVDKALATAGYEPARITSIFPDYAFARTIDGNKDFFVHRKCTDLNSAEFDGLKRGQILQVLPSADSAKSGSAWPAKHAMVD